MSSCEMHQNFASCRYTTALFCGSRQIAHDVSEPTTSGSFECLFGFVSSKIQTRKKNFHHPLEHGLCSCLDPSSQSSCNFKFEAVVDQAKIQEYNHHQTWFRKREKKGNIMKTPEMWQNNVLTVG